MSIIAELNMTVSNDYRQGKFHIFTVFLGSECNLFYQLRTSALVKDEKCSCSWFQTVHWDFVPFISFERANLIRSGVKKEGHWKSHLANSSLISTAESNSKVRSWLPSPKKAQAAFLSDSLP
jgi:hypothetical protein